MEVDLGMVGWWHAQYSELWQKAFDHAVEQQVALIREVAGTEAALQHARAVIDLRSPAARRINEELSAKAAMTPSAEMTLTQFYWSYFKPVCLGSTCALGVANYERIMRAWMLLMGDPPLKAITAATLAIFRDRVAKLPGLKGLGYVSLVTVNNYMRWLQAVIDKSGPPMRGQRDAAGVLDRVPWIKLAVAPLKMPRTVPDVLLNQLYTGLVAAEVPRVDGFKPPAWWRCLIVLTLNTGLRRGTLFGLKMSDIDWQKRTILIRPSNNKSRKVFSVHLNETAYRHLLAIRTDREKVFPWPHCSRCFHTTFHRLQNASGIAQEEHFGLHALRRTLATMLYEQSPGAAQIALGHSDQRTTQAHYVAPNAMVARALDALPQPEAFTGRLDGAA
jgi:integrase